MFVLRPTRRKAKHQWQPRNHWLRYNAYGLGRRTETEPLGLAGMTPVGSYIVGPVAESSIAAPANLITMGDGVRGWDATYEDGVGIVARSSEAAEYAHSNERVRTRHQNRLMMLFADSHVTAVPLPKLFADRSDDALAMWNRDGLPHRERLK
jgi:prepilin-type processing-associated H-X9-DG protein